MFVLSAAGFIATRTSGWSPGVWMSVEREADLEARHAGQRAGRRPDLGREVGQRADVVAEDGGGPRELRPGQLHPVAGVAGEADRDPLELLDLGLRLLGGASRAFRLLHALVRPRREVEQLLRERLGEVLDDVDLADDADQVAVGRRPAARSDSGRSASARSRRRSSGRDRASAGPWSSASRPAGSRSTSPPTMRPKMSRSVRTPTQAPVGARRRRPNRRSRCAGSPERRRRGSCRARRSRAGGG